MKKNIEISYKKIKKIFTNIDNYAIQTKFIQRIKDPETTIDPVSFIEMIVRSHTTYDKPSLNTYCDTYNNITNKNFSKNSIDKRINNKTISFIKSLIAKLINQTNKYKLESKSKPKLLSSFSKVYTFDSTAIELPEQLHEKYPGSGGSASKACMKLQTIYEPIEQLITMMEITPFNMPDSKYPIDNKDILKNFEENSLLLMDLGYFNISLFKELTENNNYFISRYKSHVKIYNPEKPNQELDLSKLLKSSKNKTYIDIDVLLTKEKYSLRMVIIPLSKKIANERKRKKKAEYKKKNKKLSKIMLQLLDYTIMITNIKDRKLTKTKDIYKIYKLRWSIELLFKTLKTHLNLDDFNGFREDRILFEIYGKLLSLLLINCFNKPLYDNIYEISIEKTVLFFKSYSDKLLSHIFNKKIFLTLWHKYLSNISIRTIKKSYSKRKTSLQMLEYYNKGGYAVRYKIDWNSFEVN